MKKFISVLMVSLLVISVSAQQKAIGDIDFGMIPKEVKKAYRSNKEMHSLQIGGWSFPLSISSCRYDESGLYQVSLCAHEIEFSKILTAIKAGNLLEDIKEVLAKAGYEVIEQHAFWPKPILMRYDEFCIVMKNDTKKKVVKVRIDKGRYSFTDRYPLWLDILPYEYVEKIADKNKMNAESLDNKL